MVKRIRELQAASKAVSIYFLQNRKVAYLQVVHLNQGCWMYCLWSYLKELSGLLMDPQKLGKGRRVEKSSLPQDLRPSADDHGNQWQEGKQGLTQPSCSPAPLFIAIATAAALHSSPTPAVSPVLELQPLLWQRAHSSSSFGTGQGLALPRAPDWS